MKLGYNRSPAINIGSVSDTAFTKSLRDRIELEMNPINVESGSDMSFLGLENIGIESAEASWPTRPD